MNESNESDLMKISEAAAIIGVNSSTVWRWIEKGYLKSIQFPSKSHRIPRSEINKFMQEKQEEQDEYTVMIIDDEQEVVDMLQDMLKKSELPLKVIAKTDELDALMEIGRIKPDVIIIDYVLQDVDGITISTRIMRDKELCKIPIILISGVIEAVPANVLGFTAFLRKPFKTTDLNNTLKSCLEAA